MHEPLYTAGRDARGRGAVPRLPRDRRRADGARRGGGRDRGAPLLPGRPPVRRRVRRRGERRRRPHRGADPPRGGTGRRRDGRPVGSRGRDRCAVRHGVPRRPPARGGGRDRANRRERCSGRRGRPALRRRRLDRRGRRRGRRGRPDRHVPRQARSGWPSSPGRFHAGRVVVADIGLEPAPTAIVRATASILDRVPRRSERDTKFTAGSLLVVGGAPGTTGAAVLAATAALRADAGYVTLAVPAPCLGIAETPRPGAGQARLRVGDRRGDPGRRPRTRVRRRPRPRPRPVGGGARARQGAAGADALFPWSSTRTASSRSSRSVVQGRSC